MSELVTQDNGAGLCTVECVLPCVLIVFVHLCSSFPSYIDLP